MLSDTSIRKALMAGTIVVTPIDDLERRLQPASLDVRLFNDFLVFRNHRAEAIDPKLDSTPLCDEKHVEDGEYFVLHPGEFVLASTTEYLELPNNVVARVEGKSSLGRLGLLVHSTAGFVDPGFRGQVTLELANVNSLPIRLYPGMPIGQLAFAWLDQSAENGYSGKYVDQRGPRASHYHRNWNGGSW